MEHPKTARRVLSNKEVFALASFTLAEYAKEGKTDAEFAAIAEARLGIPGLNARHVESARSIHDIPSTRTLAIAAGSSPGVAREVAELRAEIVRLDAALREVQRELSLLHANQRVLVEFAQKAPGGAGLAFRVGAQK